jgi:hypothetical protein
MLRTSASVTPRSSRIGGQRVQLLDLLPGSTRYTFVYLPISGVRTAVQTGQS